MNPSTPPVRVSHTDLSTRIGMVFWSVLVLALVAAPYWGERQTLRLLTEVFSYIALASLWNLLAGYAGRVSVGQQAFVGIGGYTLFSGHDVCNLGGKEMYQITIGPEGISRNFAVDLDCVQSGIWAHAWEDIASLAYVEDPLLGPRSRTLEVCTKDGTIERARIAADISREQLAAQAEAHGQQLSSAEAGDWSRRS